MIDSTAPTAAVEAWRTRGDLDIIIRPIRGDDETNLARFHGTLSPETVYTRYFNVLKLSKRVAHERLDRVCHPVADDEIVLLAEMDRQIIGVGRLSVLHGPTSGEVAFVVGDTFQRQGIGAELLRRLLSVARERKLGRVFAHFLCANVAMRRICLNAGMRLTSGLKESVATAEIDFADSEEGV